MRAAPCCNRNSGRLLRAEPNVSSSPPMIETREYVLVLIAQSLSHSQAVIMIKQRNVCS